MTTAAKPRTRTKSDIEQLSPELLEAVDGARGEKPRADWIAAAAQEKLDKGPESSEPYVDLDAAPTRPTVKFHKQLHELRDLNEFGIIEQQKLNRDGREFSKLWTSETELSEDEGTRLKMLLDRTFNQILDAPEEVRSEFTDPEKARVVLSFIYAPARQLAQIIQQMQGQEAGNGASDMTS